MNIMTKRGSLDNNITYEHFCDTKADMVNINPNYITLGSVCIVINGEDDGMEVYMANSNKEWNSITMSAGSSEGSVSSLMDLLDVNVLNPTDGQTLVYSAEEEKWVNHDSGGGSTGGVMKIYGTKHYGEEHNVYYTADKSFDDVASFIENGGIPVLIIDETKIAQCEYILRNEDFIYEIGFSRTKIEEDSIKYMEYMCYPDDTTSIPKYIGYAETSYGGSDGGDDPIPPVG